MSHEPPARPQRPAFRWGRWAIVAWFGALIALPPLLLSAGVRPADIEQRLPAEAPGFTVDALVDTDWYRQIAAWLTDRLPGRDRAVEADALIDFTLFDDSPSPRVLVGSDGWLFLRDDLEAPCYPAARLQAAADEVALMDRVLRLAGKELLFLIAPDKSGVYPDRLGKWLDDAVCAAANREAFRALVDEAGVAGYLDTWSVLAAAGAGGPVMYYPLDTHWNSLGAGAVAAAVVEHLAPGLWDPASFVLVGTESRVGDLAKLMGLSLSEEADVWEVHRGEEPALSAEPVSRTIEAVTSRVEGLPAIHRPVLMVHDSMGNAVAPLLRPYFGSLTTVWALGRRAAAGTEQSWFEERLGEADLLVMVSVERMMLPRLQGVLAGDLIGALVDRLPHRDVPLTHRMADADRGTRWAGRTGEIVTTGTGEAWIALSLPATEPGEDPYLVVRLKPRAQSRTEVRLAWTDPATGRSGELLDVVPAGVGAAVFDLSTVGEAPQLELQLGTAKGWRVSRISLVELPPG